MPRYEQIHVRVPKDTKDLIKDKYGHGALTEIVREELERKAHGGQTDEISKVKDRLRGLRDERQELQKEKSAVEADLNTVEMKIERSETDLERLINEGDAYQAVLETIESMMHENGMHVDPGHGQVDKAAKVGGCAPQDVIADLKERNPELPKQQFKPKEVRR